MDVTFLFLMLIIAFLVGSGMLGGVVKILIAMVFWMMVGNVAGHIMRGEDYGVAGNMALGLAGGIVGTMVLRWAGFGAIAGIPLLGSLVAGLFGAILLIFLARVVDAVRDV